MKVKELREVLSGLNDDADIAFLMNSGCCGDYESLEDYDIDAIDDNYAAIYFKALPGYRSCIQVGSTIKADKDYWDRINQKTEQGANDGPNNSNAPLKGAGEK